MFVPYTLVFIILFSNILLNEKNKLIQLNTDIVPVSIPRDCGCGGDTANSIRITLNYLLVPVD